MQRRDFLRITAGLVATSQLSWSAGKSDDLGPLLPTRKLGRTGVDVTVLGLGGYHIGWTTEALAEAAIAAALEEGVRFFDTAESYGPHTSEERYGRYLTPKYRDRVFLMTKSMARDGKTAREHIEGSLGRMKTDVIDLWQLHLLESPEDVDGRIAAGVVEEGLKAQAEGKIRYLGFTGHTSPYAQLRMLERFPGEAPFVTAQMPVNVADAISEQSFIGKVMPALVERNYGVLAMKTLADGHFFASKVMKNETKNEKIWETSAPLVPDVLSIEEAEFFAWSMPISVLITGAENPEFLREKAAMARKFTGLDEEAQKALTERLIARADLGKVEYYKGAKA